MQNWNNRDLNTLVSWASRSLRFFSSRDRIDCFCFLYCCLYFYATRSRRFLIVKALSAERLISRCLRVFFNQFLFTIYISFHFIILYFVLSFCFTVKVRPRVLVPRPKELPSEYHSSTKKQDIRWFSTRPFHPNSKWQFTTFQGNTYHRSSAGLRHNYCWLGQARWSQSCDLIGSLGQTCSFGVARFIPAKSALLLWNLAMRYLISW